MNIKIFQLLGSPNAGVYIVLALFVLAGAVFSLSTLVATVTLSVAILLSLGVAKFQFFDSRLDKAPGTLFMVNKHKMHLFAQGQAGIHKPVIWIGGGHGEGLVMSHLHETLSKTTRSILFDRTGAGWSELTALPLSVSSEVQHLKLLLQAAGETGPFVLAGHSFGGLFAINFAHHYPHLVAGLLLMDPTPTVNVSIMGELSFARLIKLAPWRALALQFGISAAGDPEIDDESSAFYKCLHNVARTVNRNSLQPKSVIGEAAAFKAAMKRPFDMAYGKHALGNIPLRLLLANPTDAEISDTASGIRKQLDLSPLQEENFWNLLNQNNERQVNLSTAGEKFLAPKGASHMFPYEYPEFVIDEIKELI